MKRRTFYKGDDIDNKNSLRQFNRKTKIFKHPNDHSGKGIPIYLEDSHNTIIFVPRHKQDKLVEIEDKYRKYMKGIITSNPKEQQDIFKGKIIEGV